MAAWRWWRRRRWIGFLFGCEPARSSSPIQPSTWPEGWATHLSRDRPLEATLWGIPRGGRATARLADGTRIRWSERDGWQVSDPQREVGFRVIEA